MEVMGLMLGQFVDDYTVNCIDVFAMPQSGTGVSVEAVDPVFQTKMLDMLKQTGRPEVCTAVSTAREHAFVDVVCKPAAKAVARQRISARRIGFRIFHLTAQPRDGTE